MAVYRVRINGDEIGTIHEENAFLAIRQTMIIENLRSALWADAYTAKNEGILLDRPNFHEVHGFCWDQSQ